MMGRDEEGFQCLQAVLKRVKPDGSIRILPDHHKETAVALSTIVPIENSLVVVKT